MSRVYALLLKGTSLQLLYFVASRRNIQELPLHDPLRAKGKIFHHLFLLGGATILLLGLIVERILVLEENTDLQIIHQLARHY